MPVVLGDEVCVAAHRRMHLGTADLGHRRRAAGHRLDDFRSGEEHVRVVAGHDDEIHQRRRVRCAAGTWAADHRDLRHHAREQDVGVEDVTVPREGVHPFLDAGAAGVLEGDQRYPGLQRVTHDARDLACLHLAQRAGDDVEVLAEGRDLQRPDVAVAGNDAVGRQRAPGHAEGGRCVCGIESEFLESTLVEEGQKPLAGGQQSFRVQGFQFLGADMVNQLVALGAQLFYQLRSYGHVDSYRCLSLN
ncbi:MAG: hypothetical protein AW07_00335 [Candidatus Accumulibacter sp. SK-11]|nr:MAG: hypothetical protein AW07_00335 [Candidatus Accumulibacter sp. SK-11]